RVEQPVELLEREEVERARARLDELDAGQPLDDVALGGVPEHPPHTAEEVVDGLRLLALGQLRRLELLDVTGRDLIEPPLAERRKQVAPERRVLGDRRRRLVVRGDVRLHELLLELLERLRSLLSRGPTR